MYEKILEIVLDLYSKIGNNYSWELPENLPIEIPKHLSNYEKNIFLKENLHKIIDEENFEKIAYWIINSWGGIPLKENENNKNRLKKFKNKLDKNIENLTKDEFSIISSLSKIASFYCPEKYSIYDSRVIYSLNWLIFKNNLESNYFPQPASRNSAMTEYDQKTIFNLSKRKINYYTNNDAYFEYCKLINEISKNAKDIKNYQIEMFLFSIADTIIIDDMKKSLSLIIKN